ncbi:transcription termination/antitermination protein NusG [Acidobacteriota bacterium]
MGRMSKNDPRRFENQLLSPADLNPDCWYVIVTKLKKEFITATRLEEIGIETYCPIVLPRLQSKTRPRKPKPLFTRYVFAHIYTPHDFYQARWTPGVHSVVTMNQKPVGVSQEIIDEIHSKENESGLIEEPPLLFKRGDRIRIIDGLFAELEGFFQSTANGPGLVKVVLNQGMVGINPTIEIEESCLRQAN